jgi:hypothetical protein
MTLCCNSAASSKMITKQMTSVENIWMKIIVSNMAACTMISFVDLVVTFLGYFKLECVC